MKKIICCTLLALMSASFIPSAMAQSAEEKAKIAKAEKASKVKWKFSKNLKSALKLSEETGLPVVILFTGSSWCGYCVKLEKEVLSKQEFKKGMEGVAIGVKFEFANSGAIGKSKEAQEYKITGVPSIVVVDAQGKVLGKTGYISGQSPEKYVEFFKQYAPAKEK